MKVVTIVFIALTISSCQFGNEPEITGESVDSSFIQSSVIQHAGPSSIQASAVVPMWREGLSVIENGSLSNYPWQNQNTTWTVTEVSTDVYRIQSRTDYIDQSPLDYLVETYFIKDNNSNGVWDDGDTYTDNVGATNSLFRETFSTYFDDGQNQYTRTEEITWDSTSTSAMPETRTDITDLVNQSEFVSVVEYRQQLRDIKNLTGKRVYFQLPDSVEKMVIEESGFVINLEHEGVIYRGRTELQGTFTITIENGNQSSVVGEYVLITPNGTIRMEL